MRPMKYSGKAPQHVYPDTQYLHAYVFSSNEDDELHMKNQLNKVLMNKNPLLLMKIPFVVFGETMNNIPRSTLSPEDKEDIIRNLLKIMSFEKVSLCPPTSSCFDVAQWLLKEDRNLDNTDSFITAHALCDPLSSHFLVSDDAILNSPTILEKNLNLHETNKRLRLLKITPEFQRR